MTRANFATGALIASLAVATASPAQAQLAGSKVRITASNGFGGGGYICNAAFKLTTVGGGSELQGSDWTSSRCVGFYTGDFVDNLLTLTVGAGGNYSYADLNVQVESGGAITGFSFLGYNGEFLNPDNPVNQSNFAPVTTFGDNFVDVLWDTGDNGNQFGFSDGGVGTGTATFVITTSPTDTPGTPQVIALDAPDVAASVTPEPATMTMLATGLVGMAGAARRRKRAKR